MSKITLLAVGDIAPIKQIESSKDESYDYSLRNIKPLLSSGNLIFGNLECPITDATVKNKSHYSKLTDDPIFGKRVYLRAPLSLINSLKNLGFDVLSIANNHILDYQRLGLSDTINNLSSVGIRSVGAGINLEFARRPAIIRVKSKKIGFLAYSYTYETHGENCGCAPIWRFLIRQDIKSLEEKIDVIVVSFHYGKEFSFVPTKFQKAISHFAIDSGADIVLGHHPHVLQPVEIYKSKIIAYSLGSFIFDQDNYGVSLPKRLLHYTKLSTILRLNLFDDGVLTYDLFPIWMDENLQLKPGFKKVEKLMANFGKEKVTYSNFQKMLLLFKLARISMKNNKSNIPLLASRVLSEFGLL